MNKHEAIQHHQALVAKRKQLVSKQPEQPEHTQQMIEALDKEIGRYGNVHNPKIATKAAQYIGL